MPSSGGRLRRDRGFRRRCSDAPALDLNVRSVRWRYPERPGSSPTGRAVEHGALRRIALRNRARAFNHGSQKFGRKKKFSPPAKRHAPVRPHRVGCWGARWFSQNRPERLATAATRCLRHVLWLGRGASGPEAHRRGSGRHGPSEAAVQPQLCLGRPIWARRLNSTSRTRRSK